MKYSVMALLCLYPTLVCGDVKKCDKTLLHESTILFDALFDLASKGSFVPP